MVSEKTRENFGAFVLLSFIFGIILMVVDSGIGMVFVIGLLLFLFAFMVGVFWAVWKNADWLDRKTRRV